MSITSTPIHLQIPLSKTPQTKPNNNVPQQIFHDSKSSVQIIKKCISNQDFNLGSSIHAIMVKSGLNNNVFVSNSLIQMYSKMGQIDNAALLFDEMPERSVVSWTSIISSFCQNGFFDKAISLFPKMLETVDPNEFTFSTLLQACAKLSDLESIEALHCYITKIGFLSDEFLLNSLIDSYSKSSALQSAMKVMRIYNCNNVVSWSSIISGLVMNGMQNEAIEVFIQMQENGVVPNLVTIQSVLHACLMMDNFLIFKWIHGVTIKSGLVCDDNLVLNSLVEMYAINGCSEESVKLFCEYCFTGEARYLSTETIATLLQIGYVKEGKQIHGYVIKHGFLPSIIVENSLLDMYSENQQGDSAFELFKMMKHRDIVSWNTIIRSFMKMGDPYKALKLLSELHYNENGDILPDFVTILSSIQACSNMAWLQLGQMIHGCGMKKGLLGDVFVQNSLIDLYGKCGKMDLVEQVFDEMVFKDLSTWNLIIAAYGINGNGSSALRVFNKLKESRIYPLNAVSYVNVLCACTHSGLVSEGFEIFDSMENENGVEKSMEHFACMVDLLGKSGRLEEAKAFIENMPVKPSVEVWGTLLGACGVFHNLEIAESAAKHILALESESNVWRVVLSNVYANVGKWDDVAKVRSTMRGLKEKREEGGWSSIEVRGEMVKFMVGDTKHEKSEIIYKILNG